MDTEIEIDLGLARVSDGALAMLEGANGNLPPDLFSKLLDALAEEHLRRFGARKAAAAVLKVPTSTLDTDELWHSLRMLGNWLSNTGEVSDDDPDVAAVREVIARMWVGVRGVLGGVVGGSVEAPHEESRN